MCLALLTSQALATVTNAESAASVQTFSQENIENHHSYGLYFTEKDDGFFGTIQGLFSSDQEQEFQDMLVDTDQVSLMSMNVQEDEFKSIATAMGIEEFPYIIIYINGDRDHNIHGPANEETALEIIEELERIQPKPVTIDTATSEPIDVTEAVLETGAIEETPEEHAAHGSPAAALEAHTGDEEIAVEDSEVPETVAPQTVSPPLESSGPPVEIRAKQVGEWMHESPRHEQGYIEEIGQDDEFGDDTWAKQILTAYPDVSYDIFPEPHQVINPVVHEPTAVEFVIREPVVEIIREPIVEYIREPIVEYIREPVVEYIREPIVEVFREPIIEVIREPIVEVVREPVHVERPVIIERPTPVRAPVIVETPHVRSEGIRVDIAPPHDLIEKHGFVLPLDGFAAPTTRPTTSKHTTSRPTTSSPTTSRPTTSRSTPTRPTTTRSAPVPTRPTTSRPTTVRPTTSRPTIAPRPITTRPVAAPRPIHTSRPVSKPTTTKPVVKPSTKSTKKPSTKPTKKSSTKPSTKPVAPKHVTPTATVSHGDKKNTSHNVVVNNSNARK